MSRFSSTRYVRRRRAPRASAKPRAAKNAAELCPEPAAVQPHPPESPLPAVAPLPPASASPPPPSLPPGSVAALPSGAPASVGSPRNSAPFGVPQPVGPSYPVPARQKYGVEHAPLLPETTSQNFCGFFHGNDGSAGTPSTANAP